MEVRAHQLVYRRREVQHLRKRNVDSACVILRTGDRPLGRRFLAAPTAVPAQCIAERDREIRLLFSKVRFEHLIVNQIRGAPKSLAESDSVRTLDCADPPLTPVGYREAAIRLGDGGQQDWEVLAVICAIVGIKEIIGRHHTEAEFARLRQIDAELRVIEDAVHPDGVVHRRLRVRGVGENVTPVFRL